MVFTCIIMFVSAIALGVALQYGVEEASSKCDYSMVWFVLILFAIIFLSSGFRVLGFIGAG